jgi:hypothetical protein
LPDFEIQQDILPAEILRLHRALAKCKFDITEPKGAFVFEKFGELLSRLSPDERSLILTLLEDFLHCSFFDLLPLLTNALDSIPASMTTGVSRVILLPLAETRKNGKPKSPSALLYPAENVLLPYMTRFAGIPISGYEKMELLATEAKFRSDSLIILLDDFIGSGETAVKTVERFRTTVANPSDRLAVCAVAAQQQGLDLIAAQSVDAYVAIVRSKGISDSLTISNKTAALLVMDNLERRLGVHPDYRRGYRQCEALIAMMRTPNNTFPIFWHPTTQSGDPWPAPFRRFN